MRAGSRRRAHGGVGVTQQIKRESDSCSLKGGFRVVCCALRCSQIREANSSGGQAPAGSSYGMGRKRTPGSEPGEPSTRGRCRCETAGGGSAILTRPILTTHVCAVSEG